MRRMWPITMAVLAGCGSGPGPTAGMDETRAPWQVLDLVSGTVTAYATLPDIAIDPRYRDRLMAFRLVPATDTAVGQPAGSFAQQDDEARRTVSAPCYIAVFETTRAQWQRLTGSTPWTAPAVAAVDGSGGSDDLPATGLGPGLAASTLMAWNTSQRVRLALPSPAEWEVAARGGRAGTFAWGEDHRTSTVRRFAVTWETGIAEAGSGLRAVATREANGFGLYDLAGNAWELTSDGRARGGSWADGVAMARPANSRDLPDDGWATVGLRLVYRP